MLLLLLGVVRRRGVLAVLVAGAAVGAALYRHVLAHTGASVRHLYLGSDAHADPILVGCALALFVASPLYRPGPRAARLWTALGVGGLAALLLLFRVAEFPRSYVWHHAGAVTAVAGAAIILAVLQPRSWLTALLETAPLVWIGRRSYGLYLWHLPVLYMGSALVVPGMAFTPLNAVIAWVATFAIAAASFRYLEQPALVLKAHAPSGARGPRSASAVPPPTPA